MFLSFWAAYIVLIMVASLYDMLNRMTKLSIINPTDYKQIHTMKKTQKNVEAYKNLLKDKTKLILK